MSTSTIHPNRLTPKQPTALDEIKAEWTVLVEENRQLKESRNRLRRLAVPAVCLLAEPLESEAWAGEIEAIREGACNIEFDDLYAPEDQPRPTDNEKEATS